MTTARSIFERAAAPLREPGAEVLVVRSPIAPMMAEPRVSSGQVSQALSGHALRVLRREGVGGGWLRVVGGDGYEGWVHAGYLMPAEQVAGYPVARPLLSLGARVNGPYGRRELPLGALLLPGETVEAGDYVGEGALADRFPPTADGILASARALFSGTSYQWGGVTPWGCDCSGFVQAIFALHGLPLPRDAWQQATAGSAAELDVEDPAAGRGDLLFFSDREDGRITHVALRTGGHGILHVAIGRGGLAHDSLDGDEGYLTRLRAQLRAARGILND